MPPRAASDAFAPSACKPDNRLWDSRSRTWDRSRRATRPWRWPSLRPRRCARSPPTAPLPSTRHRLPPASPLQPRVPRPSSGHGPAVAAPLQRRPCPAVLRGHSTYPAWSVAVAVDEGAALTVGDGSRGAGEVDPAAGTVAPSPTDGPGAAPARRGRRRRSRARYRRHDRSRGRRDDRSLGGRWRGRRHSTGREKRGRVDIAVGCRGHADPEVDVGGRPLGLPARAGDPDRITLGDGRAPGDCRLAEVGERDGVAVGLNRHRSARGRHDTDERHDAGRRGAHGLAGRPGDVDSPMLPRRVRIRAERVGTEHLSPQRP